MLIGELATRAGVTQKAVRYYERRGFLKPRRTASRYREFDDRALAIVQTIRRGQNLGMQLDELREVVDLINQGTAPCQSVRTLLAEKRADVARRIKELQDFDEMLAMLGTTKDTTDPEECSILKKAECEHAPSSRRSRRSI